MEAENWSSWTELRDGVRFGMNDTARQKAFEQLSYCLMYGGTLILVLTVAVPLIRSRIPPEDRRI
jgi:hypothetical protein